ncbi:tetratricopeptide repeat-containing sulfotransferase family protein [Pseudoxanthomonas koreensis]|uniref:tetratricopeptide repeat-containing sulfotransferase family protein n=1 Tax=Pseudoxanthomonas koreensis TaxID=266061 RepID=UPI001391427D|nr:sulfotransferase [Pseudoxanthomonas koreensis]
MSSASFPAPRALWPLLATAEAQAARQDWDGAIASYAQALQLAPHDAHTHVQLSYVHSLAGHYRQARDHALQAARGGATDPALLMELLPRLRTFNQVQAMLACIERMLPMSRMPIQLLLAVAAQLSYANLPERAIGFLDEARRADPDFPPTLLSRSQVLTYLGRFDEAAQDAARALRRAPEIAQGYWLQAWVRKQTAADNHVEAIRRELARPGRKPEDVALLGFALHKELDDLGRYDEAWQALVTGCRAKRSRLAYDAAATRALFEDLLRFEPASALASSDEGEAAADARTPVFIVGMHRSGTTLLEQLLDRHPQVQGLGELYDFTSAMRHATDHHCRGVIDRTLVARAGAADLGGAGRMYLDGLAWRLGPQRCFVDKLPSNFLNAGFIVHALPRARILHMVRDPMETCFSNLRELFSEANAYSYDPIELADYHRLQERLMRHWRERFPGRILEVDYARLTRGTEAEMRAVAAFCGLGFEDAMLSPAGGRAVVTASAVQVRDRIQVREQPKWAPYAQWLAPMAARLRQA